jgi:exodeoxyribonuclease-3
MTALRVLSYNIRYGGRGRAPLLAEVIRHANPDLVLLQEASDPDVVAAIAAATGMTLYDARPAESVGLLSRVPLASYGWHHPAGSRHAFLEVHPAGSATRIYGLHLRAVFSRWTERLRTREIERLLAAIDEARGEPHLLLGDFNAIAPEATVDLRQLPWWLRMLAWASGRRIQRWAIHRILEEGYADVFRTLHPADPGYTFPTRTPHVRLDYAFVPSRWLDRAHGCRVLREPAAVRHASDHFPLLTVIEA